jgi:hypothetical protein
MTFKTFASCFFVFACWNLGRSMAPHMTVEQRQLFVVVALAIGAACFAIAALLPTKPKQDEIATLKEQQEP